MHGLSRYAPGKSFFQLGALFRRQEAAHLIVHLPPGQAQAFFRHPYTVRPGVRGRGEGAFRPAKEFTQGQSNHRLKKPPEDRLILRQLIEPK